MRKAQKRHSPVIPAKAGIQVRDLIRVFLNLRNPGSDIFMVQTFFCRILVRALMGTLSGEKMKDEV